MKMNKFTKGSIAAGAGLVLLLGGAGTFMSWNDDANVDDATVTAGHLNVDAAPPTWTVNGNEVTDIANYQMAPGDTVVYSSLLTVDVEGDNLVVSPTLTGGSITATTPENTADEALARQLTAGAALTVTGAPVAGGGTYLIEEGTTEITASATLIFDFDGATNDAQDGSVDLAGMEIVFEQNLNPTVAVEQ